jgi:translation initiation factor 2 subunit 2
MSSEILPLIDFSKVKKKRKVEAENADEQDLEDIVLTKKKGKKAKKEKKNENIIEENENNGDINENENEKFPYDTLLKRLYNLMKKHNPNSSAGGLKIPTIQVGLVGKDRACWMNFEKVANSLNRNLEHLFQYVLSELGIEGTIGGENQANFKAKVTQISLQKVLTKYINDYVRCPNCKSFKTILKKDPSTRLQQIFCENCKSEKTVQVIKSRLNAGKKKK